jgi:hypothetical protein
MKKRRKVGIGLAANLVLAGAMLGSAACAAAASQNPESAAALKKIFLKLDAEGADIPFGGPIAAPLGMAPGLITVHELPPLRPSSADLVYVFNRVVDGSGYIVVTFRSSGYAAVRLDKNFDFVAAAAQQYGHPAATVSGAAAEDMLSREERDWQTIANRLGAKP